MHRGEVLGGAGRQRAVELGERPRGRQLAGALDRRPLQLAAQVALELAERSRGRAAAARRRRRGRPRGLEVRARGGSAARRRRSRPSARPGGRRRSIASRARSRISPSLPSAIAWRIASRSSSRSIRLAALVALGPPDPALERLGLGGAEEVAVEEQLEDPPVLLGLGDRRRERLPEVALVGPAHLVERRERVEDLRGPDRNALGAEVLAEGEQIRGVRPRSPVDQTRRPPSPSSVASPADADPLGDQVDVGAVLDQDAHRALEGLAVDVVGADQQQRPRPVDRLGDRGRLLQVELRGSCGRSRPAAAPAPRRDPARAAGRSRSRARPPGSRARGRGSGASAPRSARGSCWR